MKKSLVLSGITLMLFSLMAQAGGCEPPTSFRNCKDLLLLGGKAVSGVYPIDPDGPDSTGTSFKVYCDMENDGGGWTLVLLNSNYATPPKPTWEQLVNEVNVTGTFSEDLTTGFDLFLGVKYWNMIGTQMRLNMGDD